MSTFLATFEWRGKWYYVAVVRDAEGAILKRRAGRTGWQTEEWARKSGGVALAILLNQYA